jgi:hypothetical protein
MVLLPATAGAAPGSWSAPTVVTADGGAATGGAPVEAFVTPQGRSVVLTSDGTTPLVAFGDAAGAFGPAVAVGSGAAGALTSVDGAVGPDGTIAVAWASGGTAHVAIAGPGGVFGTPVDFPETNADLVAVTIAADGATSVAYRSRAVPPGIYTVSTATAPPGSSAFAEPLAISSTPAGIDSIDVAAVPGVVGVVFRKRAGTFKTYASLHHDGELNFETPQQVSSADDGDVGPQIVAEGDGTFVAAWANGVSGPAYAVRAAGAGAGRWRRGATRAAGCRSRRGCRRRLVAVRAVAATLVGRPGRRPATRSRRSWRCRRALCDVFCSGRRRRRCAWRSAAASRVRSAPRDGWVSRCAGSGRSAACRWRDSRAGRRLARRRWS